MIFAFKLQNALKAMKIKEETRHIPSSLLPTVSICIPARNEMHAMAQCLDRVLASKYPKLEIIVFDDSSEDNTSMLVRSYAYAGVRFVPGTKLLEGWLGKNHALDILSQEASGEFIVFLDVDTVIEPQTISKMVEYMIHYRLTMLSVIPRRKDIWRASVLFSPLRYFWQLLFMGKNFSATSSSIWCIGRKTLLKQGGFAPYKSVVQPEAYLATKLAKTYRCLLSDESLGIYYEKKWFSQIETSQRLLYPMAGGVWWKGCVALIGLFALNLPMFALMSTLVLGWTEIQVAALWFLLINMSIYAMYTSHVWKQNWWLGAFLWPLVILQELVLFIRSVIGYMRHTITWKGRSIRAASHVDSIVIDK